MKRKTMGVLIGTLCIAGPFNAHAAPETPEQQYLHAVVLINDADRAETAGNLRLVYKDLTEALREIEALHDGPSGQFIEPGQYAKSVREMQSRPRKLKAKFDSKTPSS
jgi:hypothetical protein